MTKKGAKGMWVQRGGVVKGKGGTESKGKNYVHVGPAEPPAQSPAQPPAQPPPPAPEDETIEIDEYGHIAGSWVQDLRAKPCADHGDI